MDKLTNYRKIIKQVLRDYASLPHAYEGTQNELIFDEKKESYLLLRVGWEGTRRIHGSIIHIDIIGDKVWVQRDGTEDGIAYDLERVGIAREDIVLGFQEPDVRQFTGYAVA